MDDKKYIDLHIHTNNSDGSFSSKEIINIANQNQTNFLAISDHDSIDGLAEFKNNLLYGMIGVNAVEFSSFCIINGEKLKLHILGYSFDENNNDLLQLLQKMREKRVYSHIKLLKLVENELKILPSASISKLNMNRYCWFDRELIKCMQKENYHSDIVEKYINYFRCNRFSYGADYDIDVRDVLFAIKSASGFAVLAHPMAYGYDHSKVNNIINCLSKLGIDGIESHQSDCSLEDTIFLQGLASKYGLLCSVGSDFHRLVNSDGRFIGRGINDNLCVTETSLTNKILEKKKYYKRGE